MSITQFIGGLWALAALFALPVWIGDVAKFHDLQDGHYKTPWYTTSWLRMPYTNLRLANSERREYWTKNAIRSEDWLVREVRLGELTYWTTLRREPVESAKR